MITPVAAPAPVAVDAVDRVGPQGMIGFKQQQLGWIEGGITAGGGEMWAPFALAPFALAPFALAPIGHGPGSARQGQRLPVRWPPA